MCRVSNRRPPSPPSAVAGACLDLYNDTSLALTRPLLRYPAVVAKPATCPKILGRHGACDLLRLKVAGSPPCWRPAPPGTGTWPHRGVCFATFTPRRQPPVEPGGKKGGVPRRPGSRESQPVWSRLSFLSWCLVLPPMTSIRGLLVAVADAAAASAACSSRRQVRLTLRDRHQAALPITAHR